MCLRRLEEAEVSVAGVSKVVEGGQLEWILEGCVG